MAYRTDQRWDRDRFERLRRNPDERDYYRVEEREGPRRSDIVLDERIERRGPRGRFEERERYVEEDRYETPRRNTAYFEQRPPPEVTGQALAPYRRPRPQFVRRQSSLDTFDRRPMARYGDEYRMPPDVPIPLPIRRARSPPRERYVEEYKDVRYRGSDEDYRDFRVREERSGNHRAQSRMRSRSVLKRRGSSSSSSSSSSGFEEIEKGSEIGRKGRTKMPKRLVHKSAVIEKGLPFEEEDDFIIVLRALDKAHIDEIIVLSKKYRDGQMTTYKYEGIVRADEEKNGDTREIEKEVTKEEIRREEIKPDGTRTIEKIDRVEKKEEVVEEPEHHHEGHHDHHHSDEAGEIIKRTTTTTTTIDPPDHHHHHQDLAVVIPRHHRNSDTAIRREIKALEAERKALQLERAADWRLTEAERLRDGDWELIERERERDNRPRNVIRVERDRKVVRRSKSRGAPPKLVGLALASLT